MKRIIINREQGAPLIVYVSSKVFAHLNPVPDEATEAKLLDYIASTLEQTIKTGEIYLQFASFIPVNSKNMRLYFSTAAEPKKILQSHVTYDDKKEVIKREQERLPSTPEAVKSAFKFLSQGVKPILRELPKPLISTAAESITPAAQDHNQRGMQIAKRLYLRGFGNEAEEAADKFSQLVFKPDSDFTKDIIELSQNKDVLEASEWIAKLREQTKAESDDELRSYLEITAEHLEYELSAVITPTREVVEAQAKQLDFDEKRSTLQQQIDTFSRAKAEREQFLASLVTALYGAAKDYYANIWQFNKAELDQEIAAFNKTFGSFVKINPDTYALSSIEQAYAALNTNKQSAEKLEELISNLLNESYATIGTEKRRNERDAFKFIQQRLSMLDPDQKYFPAIARQSLKHTFRFNDAIRSKLTAFDQSYTELSLHRKEDLAEIYETGTSLAQNAHELVEQQGPQTAFTNLANLPKLLKTARENIEPFKDILLSKRAIATQLAAAKEKLEATTSEMNFLVLPDAEEVNERKIFSNETCGDEYTRLRKEIGNKHRNLDAYAKKIQHNIQHQADFLEQIASKASESSTTLIPVNLTKIALPGEERQDVNIEDALQIAAVHAADHALIKQLADNINDAQQSLLQKAAVVKYLAALNQFENNIAAAIGAIPQQLPNQHGVAEFAAATEQQLNEATEVLRSQVDNYRQRCGVFHESTHEILEREFPELHHNISSRRAALDEQINAANADILKRKKDTHDILHCQLIANAVMNFAYWQTTLRAFDVYTDVKVGNDTHTIPHEIGELLKILKQTPDWDQNPNAARAVMEILRNQAGLSHTKNPAVAAFFDNIRATAPATNDVDIVGSIDTQTQHLGTVLPVLPTRTQHADLTPVETRTSTFWQRHSILKNVLIYGAIGLIAGPVVIAALALTSPVAVPVFLIGAAASAVGALIGVIAGAIKGKVEAARARRQAAAPAAVAAENHDDNNPFPRSAGENQPLLPPAQRRPPPPARKPDLRQKDNDRYATNPFGAPAAPASMESNISASTNPFDAPPSRVTSQLATSQSDDESAVLLTEEQMEEQLKNLDTLLDDIDDLDKQRQELRAEETKRQAEAARRRESLFQERIFAAQADKINFENDFVKNLVEKIFEVKSSGMNEQDTAKLRKNMDSIYKQLWSPKEQIANKREANLRNIVESLQVAFGQTCTTEFIESIIKDTAKQHPNVLGNVFEDSYYLAEKFRLKNWIVSISLKK